MIQCENILHFKYDEEFDLSCSNISTNGASSPLLYLKVYEHIVRGIVYNRLEEKEVYKHPDV